MKYHKYHIVINPKRLISSVLEESKNIQQKIYSNNGKEIYFRVKTKSKLDNPRRLFIKGDGKVIEAQVKPHLNLVQNIELSESETEGFLRKIEEISKKYKPFYLEFDGVGNYNQSFTFFLRFKNNEFLTKMRYEILTESKKYLTKEEYEQHISVDFIPHITVLYDDIDPRKVEEAQKLLNTEKFRGPILVDNIQIWEATGTKQKVIKTTNLS